MTHWHISAIMTTSQPDAWEISQASGFGMTKCVLTDCLREDTTTYTDANRDQWGTHSQLPQARQLAIRDYCHARDQADLSPAQLEAADQRLLAAWHAG